MFKSLFALSLVFFFTLQAQAIKGPLLLFASLKGNIHDVKDLLAAETDVNYQDNNKTTALMMASIGGHTDIVKLLLEAGADIHHLDKNGATALMYAAYNHRPDIIEILLRAGARWDVKDQYGKTALIYAVEGPWWGGSEDKGETVKLLIKSGVDVNQRNGDRTPLIYACIHNDLYIAYLLIRAGAELDHQDRLTGNTALMYAVVEGNDRMVDRLIQAGADINIPDNMGYTPVMIAKIYAYRDLDLEPLVGKEILNHKKIEKLLLQAGANLDIKAKNGQTYHNIERFHQDCWQALLKVNMYKVHNKTGRITGSRSLNKSGL